MTGSSGVAMHSGPGSGHVTGSSGVAMHSGPGSGHVTGSSDVTLHSGSEDEDEEMNVPTVFSTMSTRCVFNSDWYCLSLEIDSLLYRKDQSFPSKMTYF